VSDEQDPEVVADLKLRAYSMRDRSRNGEANYDWKLPTIVAKWKCRTPPCKTFVDVPEDTMERWEMFNGHLKARGEQPIASHEVLWCESCLEQHRKIRPDKLRRQVERMASVIRQIKAGDQVIRFRTDSGEHAVGEREALEWLKKWHHPDVPGFEQWLKEQRSSNKKPTKGFV
jgi:hypothetical protein